MVRQGRPTSDPKGESIRIRLSASMHDFVIRKSASTGKSVSEIFREYIEKDMLNPVSKKFKK